MKIIALAAGLALCQANGIAPEHCSYMAEGKLITPTAILGNDFYLQWTEQEMKCKLVPAFLLEGEQSATVYICDQEGIS